MGLSVRYTKGKYHRTADLLFRWFAFSQTSKSGTNFNKGKSTEYEPVK